MINFIICDDVKKYREMAEKVIDAYMMKNKVEYKTHLFEDYDNSFMKIVESKLSFKIYILDIETPSKSGIDIARYIRNKDVDSVLIFLTGHQELGNVVQECNKALNEILKILSKGEKFVGSLAKSLQEYDNVNLEGNMSADNAFIQGLRSMTYSTGEAPSYQYCLGVLTRGNIPEGYLNVISERHQNGETGVRRVFDHFTNQMLIQDANYPPNETAHYAQRNQESHPRGVYYNATSDMTNPRGPGTTYYHELAHMIDHASMNYQGRLSNTPEFASALTEDGQRILNLYNSLPAERQSAFLNRIRQDSAHSFSDLIDATTNGHLHGSYGHSRQYWTCPGNLQAEAFAHFFEASMGGGSKMTFLASFFPTAFGVFSSMIDSIQSLGFPMSRTLER